MENVQRGRSGMEPVADTGLPLIPRITNFCLLLCRQFFFITSNVSIAQIAFDSPPSPYCTYICPSSLSFSIYLFSFSFSVFLILCSHTTPSKESSARDSKEKCLISLRTKVKIRAFLITELDGKKRFSGFAYPSTKSIVFDKLSKVFWLLAG